MPSSYTLGDHFEELIKSLVHTGRYASASEVVRDGLRLIEDRERRREVKLAELRQAIHQGLESGAPEPFDVAEIKAAARHSRNGDGRASSDE